MERNPLASLMMGLRGGGGSTEGARAYPGGYENAGSGGKSYGTQWDPVEVANAQAYTGLDANKWAKLNHSTQFKYITEAQDWQQAHTAKMPNWELEKAIEDLTKAFPDAPQANLAEIAKTALENQAVRPAPRTIPEYLPGQPTVRAYHGTTTGPGQSTLPDYMPQPSPTRFATPEPHRTEQGVFFTPDPETASRYAGYAKSPGGASYPGAKVFPVDLDMRNSVTVDLRKISGMTDYQRIYDPQYVKTAIEQAKQQNKDFVVIKGMSDVGGEADQIIAVRPAGKVKNALTGETMYAHPLSALLAAALAGGAVSRRQRADETTIAPENIGRP